MKIYSEILGNLYQEPEWNDKLKGITVEYVDLDQWTAQKSRFFAKGDQGSDYPVALKRNRQVQNGDILYYNEHERRAAVIRISLSPVMVIHLDGIADKDNLTLIRASIELGHAIGNQHWPAVIKGTQVYVPLVVDKKVMLSVVNTHHLEGILYEFRPGQEIIPYLAPHEIRRLFGGAEHESNAHGRDRETERHKHAHADYFHT